MATNFRKVLSKLVALWADSPPISERERRRILRDGLKGWRVPTKAVVVPSSVRLLPVGGVR